MLEHIGLECRTLPKDFNWIAVLKDLVDGAPVTGLDREKLTRLAHGWPTCACGQLCRKLPRTPGGSPEDDRLSIYGAKFYWSVGRGDWQSALHLFHQIEARTTYLLQGGE